MNRTLTLAAALFFAIPLCAQTQEDPNRPPRSGSLTQDFKNDAKQAGAEIKGGVTHAADSVKEKTKKTTKKAAVAQCNDGVYSYTKKNTCSKHGGIKVRYKK